MNFVQKEINKALTFKEEMALLAHRNGLMIFPAAGIKPDGTCTCFKSADCDKPGKHPLRTGWQDFRFESEDDIRKYCKSNPSDNFAINCEGLAVIDCDEKDGGASSYSLFIEPLLNGFKTLIVQTGSGGTSKHLYLRTNIKIKNAVKLFPGIDIRSGGGLAIWAGSTHKSGGTYKILDSGADVPGEIFIADLPKGFEVTLLKKIKKEKVITDDSGIKANLIFNDPIPEGQRNASLYTYGCQLRQKGNSTEEISSILKNKNTSYCVPPLDDSEVEIIVDSVSKYLPGGEIKWLEPDLNYRVKDQPVADIDESMIPYFFKPFALKMHQALGVPLGSIMVSVLGMISGILGAAFKVKLNQKSDYSETLNLWSMLIANPSSKKTAVLECTNPVPEQIDNYFNEKRIQFYKEIEQKIMFLNSEINSLGRKDPKKKVMEVEIEKLKKTHIPNWIFLTNDSTPESLALLFKDNFRGIVYFRDEMRGFFGSLYKTGFENLRSLINEAWNGNKPYKTTRVGRGVVHVPSTTLTVIGGTQPDILSEFFYDELTRGKTQDGLLARFQLIWIYSIAQMKLADVNVDVTNEKQSVSQLLLKLHDLTKDQNTKQAYTHSTVFLSDNGAKLYEEFQKKIDAVQRNEDYGTLPYKAHLGKFGRLVLALSAQFHIVDCLHRESTITPTVDEKWVALAIKWAETMDVQIKKMYLSMGKNLAANALVSKILNGSIADGKSVRWVYSRNWSNLKSKDDVLSAIEEISDSNWVTVAKQTPPGGGAPTDLIKLNPKLIEYLRIKKTSLGITVNTDGTVQKPGSGAIL